MNAERPNLVYFIIFHRSSSEPFLNKSRSGNKYFLFLNPNVRNRTNYISKHLLENKNLNKGKL